MAIKVVEYKNEKFEIAYDIINLNAKEIIVFLHGWGSNKEIMKSAFSTLLPHLKHIYIDMPGFGKSLNENVILTTQDYAQIMKLFFKELGVSPKIVVGHSFGGKVATLLDPPCLVLLSSAGIKVPKPLKVRLKIALFKLLKPFGGKYFRKFFVSRDAKEMNEVMYETFKNVVDEDFSEVFQKFPNKALLFWGRNDSATPLWSAKKIQSLIKKSKLFEYDGDHYFFLQHSADIAKKIISECK